MSLDPCPHENTLKVTIMTILLAVRMTNEPNFG